MILLFKIIIRRFLIDLVKILLNYYQAKYGEETDICLVLPQGKKDISYTTSTTTGIVQSYDGIREICGQNKLFTHGMAGLPPKLILFVAPSCFIRRGLIKTIKFIWNWPGRSIADNKVAVQYANLIGKKRW